VTGYRIMVRHLAGLIGSVKLVERKVRDVDFALGKLAKHGAHISRASAESAEGRAPDAQRGITSCLTASASGRNTRWTRGYRKYALAPCSSGSLLISPPQECAGHPGRRGTYFRPAAADLPRRRLHRSPVRNHPERGDRQSPHLVLGSAQEKRQTSGPSPSQRIRPEERGWRRTGAS
jgi:hypothetical protein